MTDPELVKAATAPRPKISVCMATYNGAGFVTRQLETVLPQLSPGDEVVISDDSSTDGTIEAIEELRDSRIRLLKANFFRSPTYNFENALKLASGDIVFLADQDDEWVDGWVDAALKELQDVSLVVCDAHMIDRDGKLHPGSEARIYHGIRKSGVIQNLYRNGYIGCCCAFRREILEVALPFPAKIPWHDWWLGLIADTFFTTRFVDRKWIRYRRHENNASSTGEQSSSTLTQKLRMRCHMAICLLNRFASITLAK
jgi:glycosyltransferase involved in cell wall biosynthesis